MNEDQSFNAAGVTQNATTPEAPETNSVPVPPPVGTPANLTDEPHVSHKKFLRVIVITILLALVTSISIFLYKQQDRRAVINQFTNVYSFVPERVSKSAYIHINLPEGVTEEAARGSIGFVPDLDGNWIEEQIDGVVVFDPKEPMKEGIYYAVNMDTGSVQMSGDFLVDDDPEVQVVFPNATNESHEDTEITIVFNRPMVPLTTLTEQERFDLPVTIEPETPGSFKWISTRGLQFVPDTTLIPSSEYTVTIGKGMHSVDGLPIAPYTHQFTTRSLSYESISSEEIGFREPIVIDFNQSVDLDRSAREIEVRERGGGEVSIEVEYGEDTYYDREVGEMVTVEDQSKLYVYQRSDKHGRSQFWDFDSQYEVTVYGAVPLAGTKNLAQSRNTTVTVPNIIEQVRADSERSSLVQPSLFDPEGTLVVTFYEDIDKDRTDIKAKGLSRVVYGERCEVDEEGNTVRLGSACKIEQDKSTLILEFDKNAFGINEQFDVTFDRVYTEDGLKINAEPVVSSVTTYPALDILKLDSGQSDSAAALDEMYVCTNTPLQNPGEDGLGAYVKTDGYIVYGRWSNSRYIERVNSRMHCAVGQYETRFSYGLLPSTEYTLELNLTDVFGQTVNQSKRITTKAPDERHTRIQNMQKQYNVTPPDRTRLTYAAENLETINVHICKLSPEEFLEKVTDRPDRYTQPSNSECTEVQNYQIQLPPRYWVNNYFQINLAEQFAEPRGHYIVTLSSSLYRNSYDQQPIYDRTYVSVTNLAVGKKEVVFDDNLDDSEVDIERLGVLREVAQTQNNIYWVNHSGTLVAVPGATVTQYSRAYEQPMRQESAAVTNGEGVALAGIHKDIAGAVVRAGGESAVVTDWADTLQNTGRTRDASRTYIYTDRPIYRPGQTVHLKGIDRIGFDGSYESAVGDEVTLEIYDSRDTKVYDTTLFVSAYGTFAADFTLPEDGSLGTYRIEAFGQSMWFDVEEYVPAAFSLELAADQEEYTNGESLELLVQGDYYFGVPLSEGTVQYSFTAQDYHFDRYQGEYFNFGQAWYYCYSCGYGDDFLFRGKTTLNDEGRAVIQHDINFEDYFAEVEDEKSKLVTAFVTVTDSNGRSVSSQKSFIVHKGDFYLGIKTDRSYSGTNSPITMRVKSVNTNGEPIDLSNVEKTLYKVEWETFKRKEVDGGYYYSSEKTLQEVSSEKLKTDSEGNWSGQLTIADAGQYEVHVSKEDNRGNQVKAISRLYIYGGGSVSVQPNNNYELELEVERSDLSVGDTASLLIKSPYERAKALISVERGSVYDYWVVDINQNLYLHEFPILSEYAPNIYASAMLFSDDPEVRFGSVRYDIGTEEQTLQVDVSTNKTNYLPGEQVEVTVVTRDHTGRAVPAEVSLAIADLSVLALKGNPKKDPVSFFYDGFPLAVSTASNLKNILYEIDIPLGTKGGGGGNPDDLATKKRGEFKDTALWEAAIVTNSNGEATISFTLPDNLTTWQIETVGITEDTKLGVDYDEFTTRKSLMATPLKPRFIVPGDVFSLGAKIFNQTEADASVNVSLESDTLEFVSEKSEQISIRAGDNATVYFEVTAPENIKAGAHSFTFTASSESFVDTVEQVIPITPNDTYETVATAHFTDQDMANEYLYLPAEVIDDKGGLTINANATLAVFMTDALGYMATYPYGCSEQLASSLSTIGSLTSALSVPNVTGEFDTIEHDGVTHTVDDVVKDGLSRLYKGQTAGGGFSYYPGLDASLPLSIHVVDALTKLRDSGYAVDEEVLSRAIVYVNNTALAEYYEAPHQEKENIILAAYTLEQAQGEVSAALREIVEQLISDESFLNEQISSMSLAYLALLTSNDSYGQSLSQLVYDTLINRIDIDGRGAYLRTHEAQKNLRYFETSIKNTALLLKALTAHEDEHPMLANVLRWLLASRDKDGVWGSTHNTFIVVDSMIDYLTWQQETESHFTLRGLLDGFELFKYEFEPSNIFKTFTHFVPLQEIVQERLLPLVFERTNHGDEPSNFYYDMALQYFLPVESVPPRDEGITITRGIFTLADTRELEPLGKAEVGEVLRGKLTVTIPDQYNHVAIEDMIPAGFEIVNFNLDTEDSTLQDVTVGQNESAEGERSWLSWTNNLFGRTQTAQLFGTKKRDLGGSYADNTRALRPTHVESHDDRVFLYVESLAPGVYEYEYYIRALVPGEFQHLPARAEQLFFPEVFGRTEGNRFTITPAQ